MVHPNFEEASLSLSLSPHSKPSSRLFRRADSRSLLRGNKEDPLKVVKEGTVKSTVERMNALAKQMVRKLIIHHVDDNVVAKVKSAGSSSRTRPPPHFKSQPVNTPPPQSKITEVISIQTLSWILYGICVLRGFNLKKLT